MKKPVLLFTLKCAVIIYCTTCMGMGYFNTTISIAPKVTKGSWKVYCFENTITDNTCIFEGYSFIFNTNGKVAAVKGNITEEGYWLEDNINNKITISFKNTNSVLNQLTDYWDVASIDNGQISLQKKSGSNTDKLYITAL
jgi:uncharacterized Zn-binding protein involved in type VI secretion